MQDGSVTVERRKRGPDVWCFRWREGGPDGRKIHRRIVLGTADDLRSIASAHKAVVGLRREINLNDVRTRREAITLADLSRHFQQRELVRGNTRIAYSTRKAYEGYLRKWIEPRWGEYRLFEIRAVEVESWLKSLNRAPGTRFKMRNVMSLLFNHGRRHDLCDRNPIQWVRQGAKRRTAPDILTSDEVQGLLANLRFRERTLVLLAVTTGLRRSELFALKWRDLDFQAKQIHVTRSIVQNVIGVCKTESSQKPVPAHDDLIEALREWHRQTRYQSSDLSSPLHFALVLTCAATALRSSEILALRWSDVLWGESRIRISKRWAKGEDGETKTDASDGYVPLHPVLAGHLREWHKRTPHAKPTDFVFPSMRAKGRKPLYASTFVADRLRPAALAAGVQIEDGQRFGLHNLRHSLSNWLVNKAKVEPKTVQGILRHSKIQTTLDLYTQEDSDETRAAQGEFLTAVGMTMMVQQLWVGLWVGAFGFLTLNRS